MQGSIPFRRASLFTACATLVLWGCSEAITTPLEPEENASATLALNPMSASPTPTARQLVSGLAGASGSTVGPGGDLFVTEGASGSISRVDPTTGEVEPFATGLPPWVIGSGGAVDVAFVEGTAYVLVTLVSDPVLFPTGLVNGIYRMDGPGTFTPIIDIGAYNVAHPPSGFDFFVSTGVLYALEAYRGGLLVTDGHLNRVLHVTLDGEITELQTFGNVVPTGLEVQGNTIYMAEAGPTPHLPENGRVMAFAPNSTDVSEVAAGAPLLVDVERGRGETIFALAQGHWDGAAAGDPAEHGTGSLVKVEGDGTFSEVLGELDQPTSLEIIGNTAYVVTLPGDIWAIDNIAAAPYSLSR
ncbi:MAG: ScyD/ScyE family protein [Gemmatimonadota bacterium]|jgi:hypothetical protein